jgi:hypothetical protein
VTQRNPQVDSIQCHVISCGNQRTLSPVTALPVIMRRISDAPWKMAKIRELAIPDLHRDSQAFTQAVKAFTGGHAVG